jgi:hypothetical protein
MATVNDPSFDTRVVTFESPAAIGNYAKGIPSGSYFASWGGGVTWQQAINRAVAGDTTLVAQAEDLIAQLEVAVEAPRSEWTRSAAGAYPIVPEALAGHPDPMRRRHMIADERAPLRVVIDLTSSAGISAEQLERRGVAYLALAMFLSVERPVTLEVAVGMGGHRAACFVVVGVPAAPLDLATACNALTSAAFARGIGYQTVYKHDPRIVGAWPWNLQPYDYDGGKVNAKFVAREREALGLGPDDILAPPAHIHDPAITDPVGFVRRAIEQHTNRNA